MKLFLTVLAGLFMSAAAYAQSVTTVPASAGTAKSGNVIVVNGKKFFLLGNVRHYNGGANNPSALSVMHHPRPPARPHHGSAHLLPAAAGGTAPPGDVLTAPVTGASAAEKPAGVTAGGATDVLSIFSPDEKTMHPTGASTKQ